VVQPVSDGFCKGGGTWNAAELFGEPDVHGLNQRPTLLMAHALTFAGGLAADSGLDRVELGDPAQGLLGNRRLRGGEHVVEFSSGVSHAEGELRGIAGGTSDQARKPSVAIDLNQSAIPLQMFRRVNAFAVVAVNIDGGWVARSAPGPVVDGIAPQPSGLRLSPARVQHWQGGVIGKDLRRRQHRGHHHLMQRGEPPAGAPDPIAQSRPIQHHALTSKDLGLSIQGQGVTVFAEQNVREERLGRHPAIDGPVWRGRLDHRALARPAAMFRTTDHLHPQLSRHEVQHFGAVLADEMHRAATARADVVLDIDDHFYPR
jgi:hypothetical protein